MRNIILLFLTLFFFTGCMISSKKTYSYSNGLPGYTYKEYWNMEKNKYQEYFLNELYLTANILGIDDIQNNEGDGLFYLFFEGTSKENYKTLFITSGSYRVGNNQPITLNTDNLIYLFSESIFLNKNQKGVMYHTICDNTNFSYIPIKLDLNEREPVTLLITAKLINNNGDSIRKDIKYFFNPVSSYNCIEWIWDNW